MEYRGIITQGYYNDVIGQNTVRLISSGYVGVLASISQIFNIVKVTILIQVKKIIDIGFCMNCKKDSQHAKTKIKEVLF